MRFNMNSVLNLLQVIRQELPETRFFQPSSSDMFGQNAELPVNLSTPFEPVSPYAISKLAGHNMVQNYRELYGIYAAIGVMFNHESYLRAPAFFVKKILRQSLEIKQGIRTILEVGNVDVKRDFGYAPAYVEAMWLTLQQDLPSDYMVCSGKSVRLRDIIMHVFQRLRIPEECLHISEWLYRPEDIENIYGDNHDTQTKLHWKYDLDFMTVLDILLEEEEKNWDPRV